MDEADKAKIESRHPYLSGNFAPIQTELPLTPCSFTGVIPGELAGGQYVRNGGNPLTNQDLGRNYHWFDGDGMLSGVLFKSSEKGGIQAEFTNQYILTDLYVNAKLSPSLKTPILPSIATLVNPLSRLVAIILRILSTLILITLSHLTRSRQAIKKISVSNTALYYHDGRALVTCESGPPMRIELPGLGTVGWYNGRKSEGDKASSHAPKSTFGGSGALGWFREWVTAHPRVDPETKELILYHNTFVPPFLHYSILQSTYDGATGKDTLPKRKHLLNKPVPGMKSAKMMHDFAVAKDHTIIMDVPLSLDPLNLAKNKPVIAYDPKGRTRFGVFPRYEPNEIRWFETNPCCIFHSANTWSTTVQDQKEKSLNMLCCRLTSATLVYGAGNVMTPQQVVPQDLQEEEQCRLYYYEFDLSSDNKWNFIKNQWALAAIPFEFPTMRDSVSMSAARFIYGCSVSGTTFGAALGRAVKINALVKIDVETLIAKGKAEAPKQISGCVDSRDHKAIAASKDPDDPVKVFEMPVGWYTQEARFVPRSDGANEDDGWLLAYCFDESTQLDQDGVVKKDAKSELWIIDARSMKRVTAKITLPQRVPYGLHGNWFPKKDIAGQRPIDILRSVRH